MKKLFTLGVFAACAIAVNAQTKKVILEDYTGLNCGWCPEGTVVIEGMQASHPTNFIPIAMHTGSYEPSTSPLYTSEGATINVAVAPAGYPAGGVDRKMYAPSGSTGIAMGRGYWSAAFSARASMTAIVSVSFSNAVNTGGDNYAMDVNVSFSSLPTSGIPLKLNVYVIEDSIPATNTVTTANPGAFDLRQHNYSSAVQGGASLLNPWWHNRTFRKGLLGTNTAWGDGSTIPATPVVSTTYTKHVTFTKDSKWTKKNVKLIAYVAYDGPATSDQKEIINAEEMKLTSFNPVGVATVNNTISVLSAYPNPANQGDVVYVEYNNPTDGNVIMKVYNVMGQLVATPYNSNEVAGVHTIQWKAADHNLPAGVYLMQISTADGSTTQRINIH